MSAEDTIKPPSKAAIRRRVTNIASRKTSFAINDKINELMDERVKKKAAGLPMEDLEVELVCWAEIWLARGMKLK
jgi:hypothetical protein